jgi:penicillin-binding protein 1A
MAELWDDSPEQVVDPGAVFLVTSALEGAVIRGTANGMAGTRFRGDLAGKTGTSNDWRDAWFVAYSPTIAVGVWVGFDDGRSLRHTGGSAAVPIVRRFLDAVPRSAQRGGFEPPDGVELARVSQGGDGWFDACGIREYFLEGTAPPQRGCYRFEWPDVDIDLGRGGEWRRDLRREAERFLRELAQEHGVEISIR